MSKMTRAYLNSLIGQDVVIQNIYAYDKESMEHYFHNVKGKIRSVRFYTQPFDNFPYQEKLERCKDPFGNLLVIYKINIKLEETEDIIELYPDCSDTLVYKATETAEALFGS